MSPKVFCLIAASCMLAPAEGAFKICLAETTAWSPVGYCLAAHTRGGPEGRDVRNHKSTYIQTVPETQLPAKWIFKGKKICLAEDNLDSKAGWCLASHARPYDVRNVNSAYAFVVEDSNNWPTEWSFGSGELGTDMGPHKLIVAGNGYDTPDGYALASHNNPREKDVRNHRSAYAFTVKDQGGWADKWVLKEDNGAMTLLTDGTEAVTTRDAQQAFAQNAALPIAVMAAVGAMVAIAVSLVALRKRPSSEGTQAVEIQMA